MTTRTDWQRARRPEEKEQRREIILSAAAKLLDQEGLDGTGLNAIARQAGLSKPNIYRYFESREAILIQLLLDDMDSWISSLNRKLQRLEGTDDVDSVAKTFAATISKKPRLCILIGALASVLEHNVSEDTITEFKQKLLSPYNSIVASVSNAIPALTVEHTNSFVTLFVLTASGAWPHCNPAPAVKNVLRRKEFAVFRLDFKETMFEHAITSLRGFLVSDA